MPHSVADPPHTTKSDEEGATEPRVSSATGFQVQLAEKESSREVGIFGLLP